MNITLKKLKIIESMSEETICFVSDVYLDNKLIGHAKNQGHGGPTDITPAINLDKHPDWGVVEDIVDDLVNEAFNKKEHEKFIKSALRQIEKIRKSDFNFIFIIDTSKEWNKQASFSQCSEREVLETKTQLEAHYSKSKIRLIRPDDDANEIIRSMFQ